MQAFCRFNWRLAQHNSRSGRSSTLPRGQKTGALRRVRLLCCEHDQSRPGGAPRRARNHQVLRRSACPARRRPADRAGRGALHPRPERRGQVDAHQDARRRAPPRRGHDLVAGRGGRHPEPAGGTRARHRHDVPGARRRRRPDDRREHLPRSRALAGRLHEAVAGAQRGPRAAEAPRSRQSVAEHRGRPAERRQQADRQHGARAVARHQAHHHGRAVGRARQPRGEEPLPRRAGADRPGHRRRLHHAPARGDPPDRRSHHRAEGRPSRWRPGSPYPRRPPPS